MKKVSKGAHVASRCRIRRCSRHRMAQRCFN